MPQFGIPPLFPYIQAERKPLLPFPLAHLQIGLVGNTIFLSGQTETGTCLKNCPITLMLHPEENP
jgi:hypothetical protein